MKATTSDRIARRLVDQPGQELKALMRRIGCELDFARAFVVGTDLTEILGIVARAEARLDEFDGDFAELQALVGRIEEALAPVGRLAKDYTIHCVAHGHIDMNWMWSWPETVATTHDTFASVLSFMDQYPDLTYSQSQASVYALIEKHHPAMFAEIQRRVAEGRWEVAAAHWVEGDKNLASGEALARHLLYTRAYFQEKFGLSPEDVPVDWEPDTFGHANTIPNILRQGAVKYYYSCRTGGGHEHDRVGDARPPLFWWEGTDGSRILVNRETTWYNSYVDIGENYALPMVSFVQATGLNDWLNVYGIGNHGGGPTREEIDYFIETQSWPIWPTVRFSTAKAYFEQIEEHIWERGLPIPVLKQELNYEFTGCYTSQSAIKRANRFGENYCVEAEGLAAIGATLGVNIPDGKLRDAWIPVLFNQFHDILPGSGVAATREFALGLFQQTGAHTGAVKREVAKGLASGIDTLSLLPDTPEGRDERAWVESGRANTPFVAGAGQEAGHDGFSIASAGGRRFRPFVVYNPSAWPRTEVVQVALYDLDFPASRLVARDPDGRCHAVTVVKENAWDWGHKRTTVLFVASDIPATGYKTYLLCEGEPEADAPVVQVHAGDRIETPFLAARFDRFESGLKFLLDKRTGKEVSLGLDSFGRWVLKTENPKGMSAWVLGGEDADRAVPLDARNFDLRAARLEGTGGLLPGSPIVLATSELRVPGTKSRVRLTAVVSAVAPRIDFLAEIDWREIGDAEVGIPGLAVDFVYDVDGVEGAAYESPFGTVVRGAQADLDVPTLRYASIAGEAGGFTLLQDSKYGHSNDLPCLSMRVLRSSFDPDHAPEVGKSVLRYAVVLHDSKPSPAELARLGAAQNHPLIVFPATFQSGHLPTVRSFLSAPQGDVVVTALKPAEAGGVVVRMTNYGEKEATTTVKIDPALVQGAASAQVVDLMERPAEGVALLAGDTLTVKVPAKSFRSVRIA